MSRSSDNERVKTARAGDVFPMLGWAPPGTRTVVASCGGQRGRWYCITHSESFDNNIQKDSHIHKGKHTLVWLCGCGNAEEP